MEHGITLQTSCTWSPSSSQCLKWPSLADRHKFRIIQTVHDMLHQRSCVEFNYFTFSATCTRSHSLSIFCRQTSINSFRYSFLLTVYFYGIVYPIQFCQFLVVILLDHGCILSYFVVARYVFFVYLLFVFVSVIKLSS